MNTSAATQLRVQDPARDPAARPGRWGAALPANTRYRGATPAQMVAFDSDLQRRLNPPAVTPGCYPAQHARRVVRETLARHQLTRATVRDQAGTSRFADVLVIVERGDLVVSIRRPDRDCP
jgi:hypothetical protein